jgi:hypothetical protein
MHSQPLQKLEVSCQIQAPPLLLPVPAEYEAEFPRAGSDAVEASGRSLSLCQGRTWTERC